MPDYENDMIFAPDEVIDESGYTHQQTKSVAHPWDHISTSEPPDSKPTDPEHNAITSSRSRSLATYERSAKRALFSSVQLIGTLTDIQGPAKLVDSQVGRRMVAIKCPPSNTKGAYIGHNIDAVLTGFAWLVSPSDPILYLQTEDAIWCMAQVGAAATDVLQAAILFDPLTS